MKDSDRLNNIFQTGVILGRITQLSVDRGNVVSGSGMGLADFLHLLEDEVKKCPIREALQKKILDEINALIDNLSAYSKEARLELDDARVMIGFVSRWTDLLFDEFLDGETNQKNTSNADDETDAGINDPEINNGITPESVQNPKLDPANPR